MAQDFNTLADIDMREIEKNARILRAQAAGEILSSIGAFFGRVFHIGSAKTAGTVS